MFELNQETIRPLISEFLDIYKNSPIKSNNGGMKTPHAFWTWYTLKQIKPDIIIESGIWKGFSTWLIEQACPSAKVYSIDINLNFRSYISDKVLYSTTDFNEENWTDILGQENCKNTLVFFDDHQSAFERLQHCHKHGIGHVIFEDNYPTQHGDCLSLKKIFMNNYHIEDKMNQRISKQIPPHYKEIVQQICRHFEFPPIYLDSNTTRWGDSFDDHQCAPPIFKTIDELGETNKLLCDEQLYYTFILYAKMIL